MHNQRLLMHQERLLMHKPTAPNAHQRVPGRAVARAARRATRRAVARAVERAARRAGGAVRADVVNCELSETPDRSPISNLAPAHTARVRQIMLSK